METIQQQQQTTDGYDDSTTDEKSICLICWAFTCRHYSQDIYDNAPHGITHNRENSAVCTKENFQEPDSASWKQIPKSSHVIVVVTMKQLRRGCLREEEKKIAVISY